MSTSAASKSFDDYCQRVWDARAARGSIVGEAVEVTEEVEQWYEEFGADAVSDFIDPTCFKS